jgi:hypothetical protein
MFRETLIKYPGSSVHPEPALRVCDFFKVVENRRCKQNSYDDKMAEKSKKSQTLSEAKDLCILAAQAKCIGPSLRSG